MLFCPLPFPVPHAAVEEQREALVHDAIENMKAQGINLPNDSIPANAMLDQAEQRVRLGLQISAIVEKERLLLLMNRSKLWPTTSPRAMKIRKKSLIGTSTTLSTKLSLPRLLWRKTMSSLDPEERSGQERTDLLENLMGRGQQA